RRSRASWPPRRAPRRRRSRAGRRHSPPASCERPAHLREQIADRERAGDRHQRRLLHEAPELLVDRPERTARLLVAAPDTLFHLLLNPADPLGEIPLD